MQSTIIQAATAARTSSPISVTGYRVTFVQNGLATGEAIAVQIQTTTTGTFVDLYQDGAKVELTPTNNAVTIEGPGTYRLNKGTTGAAVSASMYSE